MQFRRHTCALKPPLSLPLWAEPVLPRHANESRASTHTKAADDDDDEEDDKEEDDNEHCDMNYAAPEWDALKRLTRRIAVMAHTHTHAHKYMYVYVFFLIILNANVHIKT